MCAQQDSQGPCDYHDAYHTEEPAKKKKGKRPTKVMTPIIKGRKWGKRKE
jgi:hypothetical protein